MLLPHPASAVCSTWTPFFHTFPCRSRTSSAFFRKVLKPEWTALREDRKPIELTDPEDDPETFTIYVHWLYYKSLPASVSGKPSSGQMARLVDAYLLGEKLMDVSFKNAIIAAIIASFCHTPRSERRFPCTTDIEALYDRTTPSSTLRYQVQDRESWNVGRRLL